MKTKPNQYKILLTGASGTIGREVLNRLLLRTDVDVYVFDKRNIDTVLFYRPFKNKITLFYGDLTRNTDISLLPGNFDLVFHLAAILPPKADRSPQQTEKLNVTATNLLIKHLQHSSPEAFFLFSSCMSVYGDRLKNPFICVDDAISPCENDIYAQTKAKAETVIRSSGMRWSIFRITAILKHHKISRLMFHMPLDTKIETCSPGNVAQAFVNAIDHTDELAYRTFNLGGGEKCRITYRDFLNRVFDMAGLGTLTFPPRAFASRNYHCGFYADSDMLNEILHFRSADIQVCLEEIKGRFSPISRHVRRRFKNTIKASLLRQSSPYWAYITANKRLVKYYFGDDID